MSVAACAALVEKGDPDRFLSAMTGGPQARARLFPLYAFNLEVARAPWVASEPMIGQMRLQFWRDTLAEIGAGKPARAHEVAAPLAETVRAAGLPLDLLDEMVIARWADLERAPFADAGALRDYLAATAGNLMWASVLALGGDAALETPARAAGLAAGLASWLMAVPDLDSRGWRPLPADVPGLIEETHAALREARRARVGAALPALRAAWRAESVLMRAMRDPTAIGAGRLGGSEFGRRGGLLWKSLTGRW
ncbi:squalene/phytoene synthase family protein [Sinisalibacter aestuarii]|uniref:Phytoene synthase n=1 Tax=Sinisalibacter aestuarii TaxID=2949426 RepID=A0ABQ5LSQ4_9RHOB|nr:squalene/phytoene synthase family protein [Sinisalibacter aestuarii]GKY88020.1 phytoene synthase [Sinisalibacter aestuarii]